MYCRSSGSTSTSHHCWSAALKSFCVHENTRHRDCDSLLLFSSHAAADQQKDQQHIPPVSFEQRAWHSPASGVLICGCVGCFFQSELTSSTSTLPCALPAVAGENCILYPAPACVIWAAIRPYDTCQAFESDNRTIGIQHEVLVRHLAIPSLKLSPGHTLSRYVRQSR